MNDNDLTESLARKQTTQSDAIDKSITSEVIHDFKNILTGILGNLALARDWSDPKDKAYPFIEAAERVTKHANQLALQLLAASRGSKAPKVEIGLSKLIRECTDLIITDNAFDFSIDIDPDLSMVLADETKIIQVLNNLLINAKQASLDRGGHISVIARNVQIGQDTNFNLKPGRYVKVSVVDQGCGIAPENINKIFKLHFTTKEEGNGIGLATCFYAIQDHGGTIHVESKVDEGSTFSFLLPALDRSDADATEDEATIHQSSGHILVMDDEELVQQIVGDMLQHLGYTVCFANSGEEAVKSYRQAFEASAPFAAVIMDLSLPGTMGGQQTIAKIREIDPEVKAILSSGHVNDPVVRNCREYGFFGAINKPYSLKDLQNILSFCLAQN